MKGTFISDGEKDPLVLGFACADKDVLQPGQGADSSRKDDVEVVAPEDVEIEGVEVDGGEAQQVDGVEMRPHFG